MVFWIISVVQVWESPTISKSSRYMRMYTPYCNTLAAKGLMILVNTLGAIEKLKGSPLHWKVLSFVWNARYFHIWLLIRTYQ